MAACPVCGETNPARARFCMTCGQPLPQALPSAATEMRKTVTVVFCDVVGSTPLGEHLDPESVRRVMTQFFHRMRLVLEHHGGTVEKYIGDAVMAVFGVPDLHEDDALRAVRAAAAMSDALVQLNAEFEPSWGVTLQTRIGVNTGPVVVGDERGGPLVVGDAVNVAARLEQAAGPDEILLGAATYALVRAAVSVDQGSALSLKGKAGPVTGYRLAEVEHLPSPVVRLRPAFVGRGRELDVLRAAFEDSVGSRACRMLTVLGAAGVGKSRLVDEFTGSVQDRARVVGGRCLPYGDGITFWPVVELVRTACGIAATDARTTALHKMSDALAGADDTAAVVDALAPVCGFADAPVTIQESFWAVRRCLEILQVTQPLVVVLDDLQWAEPTLLDLVEYLASRAQDARIMLLGLARPELLEQRPGWTIGQANASVLALDPLSESDSERLIADLVGAPPQDPADAARIVTAADGNPLFIEEMLRMLEDDERLTRDAGTWRLAGDADSVPVPASIHALLAARLDHLGADEQAVLGIAAVIGKEFWWGAVADLLPDDQRGSVGTRLQTLVRKGLVVPERSALAGQDAFAFHHILIRDASYQTLPKARRADLHEGFADWMLAHAGERSVEFEEVIGHHLEQAFRYRTELGLRDARTERIATRGGERLSSAGRRALARGDVNAAVTLLQRAAALHVADVRGRAALLPDVSEALIQAGELARADEVLAEATRSAELVGDRGLLGHATMVRLLLMESTNPKRLAEVAPARLAEVIPVFEQLGDHLGLARAWRLQADLSWARARYGEAGSALDRAIEHAAAAGSAWEEAELLGQVTGAGVYGPTPVGDVVTRCESVLADHAGNRVLEARVLRSIAALRAMQGRFGEAREQAARAASTLTDLGMLLPAGFASETRGFVERLAGDLVAAEAALRAGHEVIAGLQEQGYQSTVAALLAQVLVAQGRPEDAEQFIDEAAAAAAADDVTTHVLVQATRGGVAAARGKPAQARALCLEAVTLAETTDDVNMLGDALAELARVLRLGGDEPAALAAAGRARLLFEAKGNLVQAAVAARFAAAPPV